MLQLDSNTALFSIKGAFFSVCICVHPAVTDENF